MTNKFDIESFAPNDRADAIREISRTLNGRIEVGLPSGPAHIRAAMTTSLLGTVDLSGIHWNVTSLRHSVGPMKDDVEPQVLVALQESGFSRVSQGGREAEIRPGDLILVETAKPYDISFHGAIGLATVRAPTQLLGLPSSVLAQITALRLGPEHPVVNAAAAFFSRLVRRQSAVDETEAGMLMQPCIELIRAVVTTGLVRDDLAKEPLHRTLLQRVTAYVRLNLRSTISMPRVSPQSTTSLSASSTWHCPGPASRWATG